MLMVAVRVEGESETQLWICLLLSLITSGFMYIGLDWNTLMSMTLVTLQRMDRQKKALRKKSSLRVFIDLWPKFISRE